MTGDGRRDRAGVPAPVPAASTATGRGRMNPEDRLAVRALREGWEVPAERRAELIARLGAIATDPGARPRDAVMAAKVLLMASRLTLESIRVSLDSQALEVLESRLASLESAGELAAPESGAGPAGGPGWELSAGRRAEVLEWLEAGGMDDVR